MTAIAALLEHPYAQALAWALIHFLWQGAAIGIAAWLVYRFTRGGATSRYAIGVTALALMLAAPIVTFGWMVAGRSSATPPQPSSQVLSVSTASTPSPASPTHATRQSAPRASALDGPFEPFVIAIWLSGVIVLSIRLFGGWLLARRFATRGLIPVAAEIDAAGRRIAESLGLTRLVRLFESASVRVPVTIGWIRPIVLFPMSAISGLSAVQVEALLAHELAHIRRHDYLVNLLQSAVETLLFYHPAVWWMSKQVRAEREHCCDDLVVAMCDRVVYVRALTDLATIASAPALALAATDGSLMRRVRRLLGEPGPDRETGTGWLSGLLALLLVGGAVPIAVSSLAAPDTKNEAVQTAPPQGVPTGVSSGVTTGVPGGVQSEIAGGVATGVEGGVQTAVPRSLRAVLPRELHAILLEQSGSQTAEEQAALARLVAAQRAMREAQTANEIQQLNIQLQRMLAVLEAKRAEEEAKVEELQRSLERAKRGNEKGIVSEGAVKGVEAELRAAMADLEAINRERQLTEQETKLKQRTVEQAVELHRVTAEVERAMRDQKANALNLMETVELTQEYDKTRAAYARMLSLQEQARLEKKETAPLEGALEDLRRRLIDLEKKLELQRRLSASTAENADIRMLRRLYLDNEALLEKTILVENDPARAGDYVTVEIPGEPDLPRNYIVSGEGTIKLPLLAAIRVQGLTTTQIREAILREMRKIMSNPQAQVSVRRPRRE